jgi:succinate dehydrogenase / fumarate reductase, cytochrome b subunit
MSNQFQRPLSPHLQIYRPTLTMVMSIAHRLTGMALYFGSVLFVWWLTAASMGADYFGWVTNLFGSWLGRLVLIGFTWALLHHFLGGIRHLIWDTGRGLDLPTAERLAQLTLAGSIVLTIGLWVVVYLAKG